jgi:hypothetical protein
LPIADSKGHGRIPVRKSWKLLLAVVSVLGLFAAFVVSDSILTRFEAERFLDDVRLIRPGKASLSDLVHLTEKYSRFAVKESPCEYGKCTVFFNFYNPWLYRVHAVPPTRFGGGITARNGTVSEVDLALQSGAAYDADVVDRRDESGVPAFAIVHRESAPGVLVFLKVSLTPAAPEEVRREAYLFNLACLTRFGGCNDAHAMLPAVKIGRPEGVRQ